MYRLVTPAVLYRAAPVAALILAPDFAYAQSGATAAHPFIPAVEVLSLLGTCALLLVLPHLYATAASFKLGMPAALGDRENFPELTGWLGRARRAELNLQTNLIPFAVVVLLLAIAGTSTGLTRTGALLFLGSRLVHAIAYILAIPGLRTLAFYAGFTGTLIAAWPLVAPLI